MSTTVTGSFRAAVQEKNGLIFIRAFISEILEEVRQNPEFVFLADIGI